MFCKQDEHWLYELLSLSTISHKQISEVLACQGQQCTDSKMNGVCVSVLNCC